MHHSLPVMVTVYFLLIISSSCVASTTSKSPFASPVMVSYLQSGEMHIITRNGLQFYELPSKAVHLQINQVILSEEEGKKKSLVSQWPALEGSEILKKSDLIVGVLEGKVAGNQSVFFFTSNIIFNFRLDVPSGAEELFNSDVSSIYLANSADGTFYQLLYGEANLAFLCNSFYTVKTIHSFHKKRKRVICVNPTSGVLQLVDSAPSPSSSSSSLSKMCTQSPAEFSSGGGLTSGFVVTDQPNIERFYLFGEENVLIFAHNEKLVKKSLTEFFIQTDDGGSSWPFHRFFALVSRSFFIFLGLAVVLAVVITIALSIYWCSPPSPLLSSSSSAPTSKVISSSPKVGLAQSFKQQQKASKGGAEEEAAAAATEAAFAAAFAAATTAAATDDAPPIEDQPLPLLQPKKRSAFAGKVGLLKARSRSKDGVGGKIARKQQQQFAKTDASAMLPYHLGDTDMTSLQTDALKLSALHAPQPKRPKQKTQLSVTTRSRSAGKGKSRSVSRGKGKSGGKTKPNWKSAARGGKTMMAGGGGGGGGKQQQRPAKATTNDQLTVLIAPPKGRGKVAQATASSPSTVTEVSTTKRSKSKAKTKKSSKGKGQKRGKLNKKVAAAATVTEVPETVLSAREKGGKGGGGGPHRSTSSSDDDGT